MWTPDPSIIVTAAQREAEAVAALKEQFRVSVQAHVDATARGRDYHDAVTLASYDTPSQTDPVWRAEASAFVIWRTSVWHYVNAQLHQVTEGYREVPTVEGFIAELPSIEWSMD